MVGAGEIRLAQANGEQPATWVDGNSLGESGVSVLGVHFQTRAHFSVNSSQHLICFHLSPPTEFECRVAGRALRHVVPAGSLAVLPAGLDSSADACGSVDTLIVAVDPGSLTLAAAENFALESELIVRLSGRDQLLFDLARTLADESVNRYSGGQLFWNEAACDFVNRLFSHHTSTQPVSLRGSLGSGVLLRIREHVLSHLNEPIEVAGLANIAGRSPFHFSRVFTQSVGVSPHRYVVHLRLQRAVELMRQRELGLAQIAARTGFADQSHLSRWVRRVYGATIRQLLREHEARSGILHDRYVGHFGARVDELSSTDPDTTRFPRLAGAEILFPSRHRSEDRGPAEGSAMAEAKRLPGS